VLQLVPYGRVKQVKNGLKEMDRIVNIIARMITEDPNIFVEELGRDLNDTGQIADVKSQIENTDQDADRQFAKQQQQQDKMKEAEKQARIKALKPQLDKLNKNVTSLGSSMQKGVQDTQQGADNMDDMNQNMLEIQTLLGNVSKTALQ
jgi:predicted  nucleic acid-binding Zn-ribbon protein